MPDEMNCERVREIAPDLAIGIADGQERDAALRHTVTCADCRRLVGELSSVVDEMLLVAPEEEPPLGFATRTLAKMEPARPRRRRWVQPLAVAASIVVAMAIGAGVVIRSTADDRRVADSYRSVLAQGNGAFFVAEPVTVSGSGAAVGTVFGYQGQPSWLFATMQTPDDAAHRYRVRVVTRDGRYLSVGGTVLGPGNETWGGAIPVDLRDVVQLRFEGAAGEGALVADIQAESPWDAGT